MPEKHRPISLTVEAEITYDPARSENRLHLTIGVCCVTVSQGEQEMGRIAGCIGGAIEISDKASGRAWTISPQDLWAAFQVALATFAQEGENDV